jgi:tripartite-type tricarboxylate transporter receptor subunit TctC
MLTRRGFLAGAGGAVVAGTATSLRAQGYPSRSITIVVPYAAGGGTDIVARLLGQQIHERLGSPVIVDNKPGATTSIGTNFVAKAPADGYTLLLTAPPFVIGRYAEPQPPYDSTKDFTPISLTTSSPLIVTAGRDVPATTFKEFVAYAKANPGKLNYGSTGIMGLPHLAGALIARRAGIEMAHVPYRGGGQVVNDLVAGQVDLYVGNPLEVAPHFESSGLKPLAVTSKKRLAMLPDIPTLQESGLTDFDLNTWTGLLGPASMPPDLVETLNREVDRILAQAETKRKLGEQFTTAEGGSVASFQSFLNEQHALFSGLTKDL